MPGIESRQDIDVTYTRESIDMSGGTPIHNAALVGNVQLLEELLQDGNIESVSNNGATPLMWACFNGNTSCVKFLLERGASISAVDNLGRSSLMYTLIGSNPTQSYFN